VISNVVGVSGRAILEAIIAGETDPEALAARGDGRLQCSRDALVEALRGRVTAHHRFVLRQHLQLVDSLQASIAAFEGQIGTAMEPFRHAAERLRTIPGVSTIAAHVLVAEVGIDMTRFPTARHLVSWAGLCPRLDESAGKTRSRRVRKGAPWLKTVLVQCAWATTRTRGTYLHAQYHRLKARRGAKRAVVAVAASILTAAYYILRDAVAYRDLGGDYFTQRDKAKVAQRLARRLKDLGYDVELRPAAA
jgi:transposase